MENSVPTQHPGPASSMFIRASLWIAGIWVVFLCWAGRHEMLDDALIHLRYAEVLHDRHFISFDGIHPSYGTSSLLYVGLLALLRSITTSPLLPKVVSLVAYAALLGFAYWLSRINRLAIALIFVLVSPFAVRWLTDGMETSLACFMAMVFPILLYRKVSPLLLASTALIMSLLRVDLTLLVAFGVLLLIARKDWRRAGALCIGSGFALVFIRLAMGHLLPDTAIAKEGLPFVDVLFTAAREIAATLSFGLGIVLVWIVSALVAWRVDRRSVLICNLALPVLIILAAAKGQQIHGIRYLIWAFLFSITWNLLTLSKTRQPRPVFLIALACALIAAWLFELPIALRIDRGRAQNFEAMEHGNLDKLHGEGLSADVGSIGYFSGAPICDLDGLVNGRAAAIMTESQRNQVCLARNPSFLFLSDAQAGYLDQANLIHSRKDWFNCGSVDFTNVGSSDRHTLLVRRTEYPNGCPSHL